MESDCGMQQDFSRVRALLCGDYGAEAESDGGEGI